MTLQNISGAIVEFGPREIGNNASTTLDAANEAVIMIGQILWADGGTHTVDASGSSSIGWRTAAVTFANAGTSVSVGLAAVDAATGPPARAANVADAIVFDVAAVLAGGSGGITASNWQTSVPTTGTKTVATGDLIALAIQMTARGGADSVIVNTQSFTEARHRPTVSAFTGGVYSASDTTPIAIITASDGTLGWLYGSSVFSVGLSLRTWNSGSATKEYGQLYQLPVPVKIHGVFGSYDPDADFDIVLYSDPLGTPVAERTVAIDANVVSSAARRQALGILFNSPYTVAANQPVGLVFKPGASNITVPYKTLASATHRVVDAWTAYGYGISRASGAFADANSSLDHYQIGLLISAFDDGAGIAALAADVAAIKAKTDSLTFTVAGTLDANVTRVNDIEVVGSGTEADPWGPV